MTLKWAAYSHTPQARGKPTSTGHNTGAPAQPKTTLRNPGAFCSGCSHGCTYATSKAGILVHSLYSFRQQNQPSELTKKGELTRTLSECASKVVIQALTHARVGAPQLLEKQVALAPRTHPDINCYSIDSRIYQQLECLAKPGHRSIPKHAVCVYLCAPKHTCTNKH